MTKSVKDSSHREILKSSSIIAGASVLNVLIGLIRIKFLAIVLGPVGVGVVGLLQNLMATASTVSALGLNNVGTRQIAAASGRGIQEEIDLARRALFWGTIVLSVCGGGIFWIFRSLIAELILNDPTLTDEVGYLAIGIVFTVVYGSQRALLNGMRRIADIAYVSVISAALSTAVGIVILRFTAMDGISFFVISAPLSVFLVSYIFVTRLPKISTPRASFLSMYESWKVMIRIGTSFMIGSLVAIVGQLIVRSLIQRELGAENLGFFQASWIVSATYLGFVLSAMGTDYYPRLTAVIADKKVASRLVNEQSEVCILLAGPLLILMLAFTPWIIELLYSNEFSASTEILRWQTMGDVLKVVSWPLGYVLLAAGNGRAVLILEGFAMIVFVLITWMFLAAYGVAVAGFAYFCMYLVHLAIGFWMARNLIDLAWSRSVAISFLILLCSASSVALLGVFNPLLSIVLGVVIATIWTIIAFVRLATMADLRGAPGKIAKIARSRLLRWRVLKV